MKKINFSKLTENQLVNRVQNKCCNDSMLELINRHTKLVCSVIHRFSRRNIHIKINDLLDDQYLIFDDAVKTFNVRKKTKFTSWLYARTRFWILNNHKNEDKLIHLENQDIEDIFNKNEKFYHSNDSMIENNKYIFNILGQVKDKRIIDIFKIRYFNDAGKSKTPWKEIANKFNLSITRVISLHEEGRKILLDKFNSKNKMDVL
jgi:RNA polymerase sigma factor (sigma-70 family)